MKNHKLLNYLKCKRIEDRYKLDDLYYTLDSYILHGKKMWGITYKRLYINRKLFGIEIIINK